jgi:acyl dehydratase
MTTGITQHVGATVTLTKTISEADVALFTLVTDDQAPGTDEPMAADGPQVRASETRVAVPSALLAALLATAAARHAGGLPSAVITRADLSATGVAWAGDTLTATAEVTAYDDASHSARVRAQCANQDGQRLAEGNFELVAREQQ